MDKHSAHAYPFMLALGPIKATALRTDQGLLTVLGKLASRPSTAASRNTVSGDWPEPQELPAKNLATALPPIWQHHFALRKANGPAEALGSDTCLALRQSVWF